DRIMKKYVFVALSFLFLGATQASTEPAQQWRFTVFLDNKEIGYHNFQITDNEDRRSVVIDAQFNVKFLFFNAYRYQHNNREIWSGGCLQGLESRTDDNGELFKVDAKKRDERIIVESLSEKTNVSGCVKSFAYWDASFLSADKLLNAQTGEYLDVEIKDLGSDQVQVKGKATPARRYRLTADELTIDL
ncbi:MAG: DUF6134 family protein, partial [Gammaproteobacteria bacterium]|nr:DUF6134 family protein [Gammaproteobacteria bacterium]